MIDCSGKSIILERATNATLLKLRDSVKRLENSLKPQVLNDASFFSLFYFFCYLFIFIFLLCGQ